MVDTETSETVDDTETSPEDEAAPQVKSGLSVNPIDVLAEVEAMNPQLFELAVQRAANKALANRVALLEDMIESLGSKLAAPET